MTKNYSAAGRNCFLTAVLLLMMLPACVIGDVKQRDASRAAIPDCFTGIEEKGLASWYGTKFHGRPTASGEIYDMDDMTAAHKTAPLGTWAYVTHVENQRTVLVKINDRGPFVRGRVIDLSRGAARVLEMEDEGVSLVKIKFIGCTPPGEVDDARIQSFTVQVGAFVDTDKAHQLKDRLQQEFSEAYIETFAAGDTTYYRVRVGSFSSRNQAIKKAGEISRAGYACIIMPR